MLRKFEKRFNDWLIDFIIGGSYLNDYRTNVFEKIKKIGREAYEHILTELEKLRKWYRD